MARTDDPDYVTTRKGGGFDIQLPIVHPPRCVCVRCKTKRPDHLLGECIIVRTRRVSPYPTSRKKSGAHALSKKAELESELREAALAAQRERIALAAERSVGDVCAYYLVWQLKEGKAWERDQYRVREIEKVLGHDRDAEQISYLDHERMCDVLRSRGCSKATIRRYTNVLMAVFNRAVKAHLIKSHQLVGIERPKAGTTKKPVIFTRRQVAVLLGSAMQRFEREQADALRAFQQEQERRIAAHRPVLTAKPPSVIPLRGFCLIAYLALMRPETNFELAWEQLTFHSTMDRGRFTLDRHKNKDKGVEVNAPLKPELVRYLKSIMPPGDPEGLVHPNPETGAAYVNIRKQWFRLVEIANEILGPDEQLTGVRTHFYTWRHTGASNLAASSKDPVLVTRMMGDTQLQTVMKHYFDSDFEHMQIEVERWELPVESGAVREQQSLSYESGIESDPN